MCVPFDSAFERAQTTTVPSQQRQVHHRLTSHCSLRLRPTRQHHPQYRCGYAPSRRHSVELTRGTSRLSVASEVHRPRCVRSDSHWTWVYIGGERRYSQQVSPTLSCGLSNESLIPSSPPQVESDDDNWLKQPFPSWFSYVLYYYTESGD